MAAARGSDKDGDNFGRDLDYCGTLLVGGLKAKYFSIRQVFRFFDLVASAYSKTVKQKKITINFSLQNLYSF